MSDHHTGSYIKETIILLNDIAKPETFEDIGSSDDCTDELICARKVMFNDYVVIREVDADDHENIRVKAIVSPDNSDLKYTNGRTRKITILKRRRPGWSLGKCLRCRRKLICRCKCCKDWKLFCFSGFIVFIFLFFIGFIYIALKM